MEQITVEKLIEIISEHRKNNDFPIDVKKICLENMNLEGIDLSFVDFSWSNFKDVNFSKCIMDSTIMDHTRSRNVSYQGVSFVGASLRGADFRGCDLSDTNCDGAIFTNSILLDANLHGLRYSEKTVNFRQACPEDGYFFGYKKCVDDRLVKLLIPKDSKRCSSTSNACRCEKAMVVAITNLDGSGFYEEACSFVDENFFYRLGEMVYADSYHEDRWLDSSHGIHFWMTKEEALAYM